MLYVILNYYGSILIA